MAGYLDESKLQALEDAVAQAEALGRPLLMAIHHPSLPMGSKWLNEIGVYHYGQIASWSAEESAWVDAALKLRGRIERDNWIDQAKDLAGKAEG